MFNPSNPYFFYTIVIVADLIGSIPAILWTLLVY